MAEFAPQYSLYKTIGKLKLFGNILFWFIPLLSISHTIYKKFVSTIDLTDFVNILNLLSIVIFFIIELVVDYILVPMAENKRRDDFIDNSFGSKHQVDNSKGYFDTDSLNVGLYKASVNLFENCFFTSSLVKGIFVRRLIIPAFIFLLSLVVLYFGLKANPVYIIVLQAFFSVNVFGEIIKNIILATKLHYIEDHWFTLFQTTDLRNCIETHRTKIYRYWLQYETLLSKINADIPDGHFRKHNPALTKKWEEIKVKYNIN